MSILINNISEKKEVKYLPNGSKGIQHYEVCLNRIPLSEFEHNTEDGMVVCMQKAYESLVGVDIDQKVREHERDMMYKLMRDMGYAEEMKEKNNV